MNILYADKARFVHETTWKCTNSFGSFGYYIANLRFREGPRSFCARSWGSVRERLCLDRAQLSATTMGDGHGLSWVWWHCSQLGHSPAHSMPQLMHAGDEPLAAAQPVLPRVTALPGKLLSLRLQL
jgi:hypothetical protein